MTKREYPLFLIDRSRHATYPFDYIVCMDREVGFVARVVPFFRDEPFNEFIAQSKKLADAESTSITHRFKRSGGLVIVIEDFLYYFEWTGEVRTRIRVLLKKALKKYIHAEVERTPNGDFSIESQIEQQQLSVEHAKSNYEDLLRRAQGDKTLADYQIALAEAILDTLRRFRDNQKFLTLNMN